MTGTKVRTKLSAKQKKLRRDSIYIKGRTMVKWELLSWAIIGLADPGGEVSQ